MDRPQTASNNNGGNSFGKKIRKPRTARACNFCRHRKIKCDGKQPCSNCQETDSQTCEYTGSIPKNLGTDLIKKSNSLEERLARVESLLEGLGNQRELTSSQQASVINKAFPDSESKLGELHVDRFSGSHFHFCSNSIKLVELFKAKLLIEFHELLVPLENMPAFFSEAVKSFEEKWIVGALSKATNQDELLRGSFPTDSKFVMSLLQEYYVQDVWANFICSVHELKDLFDLYYNGKQRRELQVSEILLMNMAIMVSIRGKLDHLKKIEFKKSHDKKFIQEFNDLGELHDSCFSNSMFYYHRVLLLNEGIQTVKSLMLMIIYAEYNIANSRLDHGLLCLAVNYALDIGLQNTPSDLSNEQFVIRKRLWCAIEYFDMEMAYRKGKAPFIKSDDLSKQDNKDRIKDSKHSVNYMFDLDYEFDYSQAFYEFTKDLTSIRRETYTHVVDSSTSKTIMEFHRSLKDLRSKMHDFSLTFPFEHRPFLISDESFNIKELARLVNPIKVDKFLILTAQITYISHLMFLNTIPFLHDMPISDQYRQEYPEFRNTSKNCARTILNIATLLDCQAISAALLNTVIHHVISAFLCLLHECTLDLQMWHNLDDLKLLIKVSRQFFSTCLSEEEFDEHIGNSELTKEKKYELLCVGALDTAAKIVGLNSSTDHLEHEHEFNHHVDKLRQKFPSVFDNNHRESIQSPNTSESVQISDFSPMNELYSTFTLDFVMRPELNERLNSGDNIWNEVLAPTTEHGVSSLHEFFFDSTLGN